VKGEATTTSTDKAGEAEAALKAKDRLPRSVVDALRKRWMKTRDMRPETQSTGYKTR